MFLPDMIKPCFTDTSIQEYRVIRIFPAGLINRQVIKIVIFEQVYFPYLLSKDLLYGELSVISINKQ
ncbi:MAG: hypothetical protein FWD60_03765 [Candidatus Azobacteroides sp.]|nr:hypothetical protein [Candidatus Azobacteroides sp.]